MTMVSVGGEMLWPLPLMQNNPGAISLSQTGLTLDSTTDALAWVGKAWFTDSIEKVYFRTGTIGGGGGDTVDVRIETVTNGRPSGTLWATNTNVTVAIADTDDNVWKTATLTAAASLVPGDEFAIVIISSAGTPNIVLAVLANPNSTTHDHYPLLLQNATGSYATASGNSFEWIVQLSSAGVVHVPGLLPVDGNGTITAYNSGSSPDEIALRFQLPFKARCIGIRPALFNIAAGADLTATLWPASSTTDADALGQITLDGDFALATTTDGFARLYFDSAVTLEKATTYYAGVRADTANNIGLGELTSPSGITNSMRGFPIPTNGEIYRATRVWTAGSAAAWTETATNTLPLISLIIDQVDDGTGAGGTTIAGTPMRRGMV